MRVLASSLLLALVIPGAARAGAPLPGFELRAQSEHFAFYGHERSGKPDVKRSERFLAQVEKTLGHDVAGRSPYVLVEHASDIFAATGLYAEGVTDQAGMIMSVRGYHPHEIVHRVAGELGDPGLLFHEGLAVALGEKGRIQGERVDGLARRALERHRFEDFLEGFRAQPAMEAYAVAGSFVGHLLRRHSAAQVADFFRACGRRGRPCPEAFARIFGIGLEQAAAEWQRTLA